MDNVVKYFNSIEATVRKCRTVTIAASIMTVLIVLGCVGATTYAVMTAKSQIYVVDNGSAYTAKAVSNNAEKDMEARDHVARFHELLFNLAPSAEAIKRNTDRALLMSDRSAYDYCQDLSEKGFYERMVSANISQQIVVDSVKVDVGTYPYEATTFGKLYIMRESNITQYQFESRCRLVDVARSDSNPHGLMIERFRVTRNENIATKKRK